MHFDVKALYTFVHTQSIKRQISCQPSAGLLAQGRRRLSALASQRHALMCLKTLGGHRMLTHSGWLSFFNFTDYSCQHSVLLVGCQNVLGMDRADGWQGLADPLPNGNQLQTYQGECDNALCGLSDAYQICPSVKHEWNQLHPNSFRKRGQKKIRKKLFIRMKY